MSRRHTVIRSAVAIGAAGFAVAWVVPATATSSSTSPTSAAPAAATSGVPWSTVHSGWSVVTHDAKASSRLSLISPNGTAYRLGQVKKGDLLQDVSSGARSAVFAQEDVDNARVTVRDLRTKRDSHFTLRTPQSVRFLDRSGGALLVTRNYGPKARVEVRSRTGKLIRTLYRGTQFSDSDPLPVAGGRTVVIPLSTGLAVVDTRSGRMIRRLPDPAGHHYCHPTRQWDSTHFVVSCLVKSKTDEIGQVFVSNTSGKVRKLTSGKADGHGWWDAWPHRRGAVAVAGQMCGAGIPHRLTKGKPVLKTGYAAGTWQMVALVGDRAIGERVGACPPSARTLTSHDLVTGKNRVLSRSVTSVAVVDPRR
ncbi:hypothetical protein [Janibacter sp. GXQ6167]|uniref:hypothetical protein n=1 Tax=Janibacter sp. GXQ6167 TaxID=3240791 RepID=UPI0035248229